MNFKKNMKDKNCELSLSGKFTFADHQNFRNIVNLIGSGTVSSIVFDLANLEFVDSAALGMFLVAREEGKKHSVDIILQNPVGHVQKMFEISNFRNLFEMR